AGALPAAGAGPRPRPRRCVRRKRRSVRLLRRVLRRLRLPHRRDRRLGVHARAGGPRSARVVTMASPVPPTAAGHPGRCAVRRPPTRRRTATGLLIAVVSVLGAAHAQYGYPPGPYDMYGYPYPNYQYPYVEQYGNPYGNPYAYGDPYGSWPAGMPTMEQLQQQSDAFTQYLNQQMAALQQQIDAYMAEAMKPFVKYYRDLTGDHQLPDAQAGQAGMKLWCDNHP